MNAQSGNEIIEEARHQPEATDVLLFDIWTKNVERAVSQHGKTMDDKIFILEEDGRHYMIDPNCVHNVQEAYDRAMKGI